MSRDYPSVCDCGHTSGWHEDWSDNWGWCGYENCMCIEFSNPFIVYTERQVEMMLTGQEP